jgi:multidrug efflux pump subunit AcrB
MQHSSENPENYWFARHSKFIVFLILILGIVGVYAALGIPVAVFPTTNFPRIIVGVDNGVMPIEQMEVTITRPIEQAVNSVPGLEEVRSITSRRYFIVQLECEYAGNPPAGRCRGFTRPEQPSIHRTNSNTPDGFRQLSHHRL